MFPKASVFLLVDDSVAVRTLVKQQLHILGFKTTVEAENGEEAITKLNEMKDTGVKVDLIISDWNMPKMSGIDLLMNLKAHSKFKIIPFLMITSEAETESVIRAIVLGVTDFVVKPFDENILLEKLRAVWKKTDKGY